jgi:hypothetical protein
MGFQTAIAEALLETLRGCLNCEDYERQLISLDDPSIECSTLAVSVRSFAPAAQVADCAVYEMQGNLVLARCCVPVAGKDGGPPPADEITRISTCLLDDVEAVMCCITSIQLNVPGAVAPCKPQFLTPAYTRPQGGCLTVKIGYRIPGVPCCAP